MLRLCPPGHQRMSQAVSLDVTYGGAEANTAVSLAQFGVPVSFITKVPKNDLGEAAIRSVLGMGVETNHAIYGGNRLGVYFLEMGAGQRGSRVIYDRQHSAMATIGKGEIDWKKVLNGAGWFHWTGITPAISKEAYEVCAEAVRTARSMGLTISCDLNYRSALWKYGQSPSEVMPALVSESDVLLCDPEACDKMLGLKITDQNSTPENFFKQLKSRFPNLNIIASTYRHSIHAGHQQWTGALWAGGKVYSGKTYELTQIVDRVGSGDAFMAGLIYGIQSFNEDYQKMIEFSLAASCLKHSVPGDFNRTTLEEIDNLMRGDHGGKVRR